MELAEKGLSRRSGPFGGESPKVWVKNIQGRGKATLGGKSSSMAELGRKTSRRWKGRKGKAPLTMEAGERAARCSKASRYLRLADDSDSCGKRDHPAKTTGCSERGTLGNGRSSVGGAQALRGGGGTESFMISGRESISKKSVENLGEGKT